ncbi:MAG: TonB-dependent receptor [Tannerellaceae bacterium]|jgi:TonB-linked SusC/RagA family outer membrane protein|nr:TonB-dependent receptor [Tannerellaceae bacterium]
MKKLIYLLFCLTAILGSAFAQTVRVTGNVLSADDGEPIIGASVMVKGTTIGEVTDLNGTFTINAPAGAKTLVVSYVGMISQEVPIKPNITVTLASDTQKLEEIIVVGYGTQRKKDVTSSISRVGGDDIASMATPSFDSQLAGRAAGVQVTTAGGGLGTAPKFRVRGFSTISSGSDPLVVIDGVPVNSGQNASLNALYNPLGDINPNDIQSIEILKDGAATAIYGSRAANGVVLITTKKGAKGQMKVVYDGYVASSKAAKLHELLNAREFVDITNEILRNWEMPEDAVYDPNGPDTNWNDYVFRNGFQHSHNISASGGTDRGNYYASLGYSNQEGIIRANALERFNIAANVTQRANKWLQIGMNVNASQSAMVGFQDSENGLGSVGFATPRMLPNVAVFNPDDPTGFNIDAAERKSLGRGVNKKLIDNGIANIVWTLDNNVRRNNVTRLIGSAFADINLMKGLTLRTQGGIDYTQIKTFLAWMPESGDGYGRGGYLDEENDHLRNWNWQNTLNFEHTLNNVHNLNITLLQEYTYNDSEWTEATVQNLSDRFFMEHIITGTYGIQEVYGSKTFNGLASYLARVNYNYDSKYYIGASIRRDGLSKLPPKTRWGTFYGGSLAYRISRESFWAESSFSEWFNDLRIRASLASVGNSDLGSNFPYLGTYGAKRIGAQTGIAWTNMGNDRLKWEASNSFDIGLDGMFFNGRLGFEMAFFNRTTKDLVMEVPTPPALGVPYNRYYDNVGALKNTGFELTLNATPVTAANGLVWQANLNFATVKNTVTKLLNGQDIVDVFTITREGESFESIYGFDYYGVNKANGNPIWRKTDGTLVQFDTFGSYDYAVYDPAHPEDVSKTASLSASEDRKILGSTLPTWYGGFNNTLTYKDFDLNIFFRFSGGNKIMNASRQRTLLNLDFANKGKEILGRWQSADKPGDGMTPRLGYSDDNPLFNTSVADSHFVEDGSFLKLSNLAIGYTLPKSLVSKLDISKIRFYIQGQNLLTFTKYTGLDPETSSRTSGSNPKWRQSVDWDGMPQQRIFSFGANITF